MMDDNIILIGMPGCGKSTVGIVLAKTAGMGFVDTDILIQLQEARTLQDIVDTDGYLHLREIEQRVILGFHALNTVVATGGSAVYSERAIHHLKEHGRTVYLDVPLEELERRVGDYTQRGLAKHPDQSFDELFAERTRLYLQHADLHLPYDGQTPEDLSLEILARLGR